MLGYVDYRDLTTYSKELKEAIKKVKSESQNDTVNIIAHSMGGLIARCAAQDPNSEKVNKIITLDTGHLGFELAGIVDELLKIGSLPQYAERDIQCSVDASPKSRFIKKLKEGFTPGNYELVSLAADEGIGGPIIDDVEKRLEKRHLVSLLERELGPRLTERFKGSLRELFKGITVVDWKSSSMGQCDDDGNRTNVNCNIKFDIVKEVDHLTIAIIKDRRQTVYQQIIRCLR